MKLAARSTRSVLPRETRARRASGTRSLRLAMPLKRNLASVALTSLYRLQTADAAYFVNLARLGFRGWIVATVIPERDFLAGIERNTRHLLWLLLGFTAAMAVLAVLLSHRLIVSPLRLVEAQLRHIEAFRPERIRPARRKTFHS